MPFKPKNFIIITGPSGAGKTSAATELFKRHADIRRLVTYTTRKKRDGEKNGVDYNFVSRKVFQKMIDNDELSEWSEVYENFYGNKLADMEKLSRANRFVVMVLDIAGAEKMKKIFPTAKTFFLTASVADLIERIKSRGKMEKSDLALRVKTAKKELAMTDDFDYVVPTKTGDIVGMAKKIEKVLGI
jgi:guanylate kinase